MIVRKAARAAVLLALVAAPLCAWGQGEAVPIDDLSQLSIGQLINLEVTSPSKKPENISQVASAVYVVTKEDIRRSGVTTLMDALRLVPGMDVARIDNSQWAISARGFNGGMSRA